MLRPWLYRKLDPAIYLQLLEFGGRGVPKDQHSADVLQEEFYEVSQRFQHSVNGKAVMGFVKKEHSGAECFWKCANFIRLEAAEGSRIMLRNSFHHGQAYLVQEAHNWNPV